MCGPKFKPNRNPTAVMRNLFTKAFEPGKPFQEDFMGLRVFGFALYVKTVVNICGIVIKPSCVNDIMLHILNLSLATSTGQQGTELSVNFRKMRPDLL